MAVVELGVERERDLREEVDQPQAERGLDRLCEPPPLLDRLLVAEGGDDAGEVALDRIDVQLHDPSMTSF